MMLLPWGILVSAIGLLGLKVWLWLDVRDDWRVARALDHTTPSYRLARGHMRMAWLRLTDGLLWLTISVLVVINALQNTHSHQMTFHGRVVLLVLVWFEIAKIVSDRLTRMDVLKELLYRQELEENAMPTTSNPTPTKNPLPSPTPAPKPATGPTTKR